MCIGLRPWLFAAASLLSASQGEAAALRILASPEALGPARRAASDGGARANRTSSWRAGAGGWEWVVGAPGASCLDTCPGAEEDRCNEEMIRYMDTEAEVTSTVLAAGSACDATRGFAEWAEFPFIRTTDAQCAFWRPMCSQGTMPESYRFCSCGGTWTISALGGTCTQRCNQLGAVCEDGPLEEVNTPEKVLALGDLLGLPCDESYTIYGKEYPSQLGNGACAYTNNTGGYHGRCKYAVEPTVRRLCPCKVA